MCWDLTGPAQRVAPHLHPLHFALWHYGVDWHGGLFSIKIKALILCSGKTHVGCSVQQVDGLFVKPLPRQGGRLESNRALFLLGKEGQKSPFPSKVIMIHRRLLGTKVVSCYSESEECG